MHIEAEPQAKITVEHYAEIIAIACTEPSEYSLSIDLWSLRELRQAVLGHTTIPALSEAHLSRILGEAQNTSSQSPLLAQHLLTCGLSNGLTRGL